MLGVGIVIALYWYSLTVTPSLTPHSSYRPHTSHFLVLHLTHEYMAAHYRKAVLFSTPTEGIDRCPLPLRGNRLRRLQAVQLLRTAIYAYCIQVYFRVHAHNGISKKLMLFKIFIVILIYLFRIKFFRTYL